MQKSHHIRQLFFDASEIPHIHIASWQNKSPEEKSKSLSCLLLQSWMAGVRTGITQQWRNVHFLSKYQPSRAGPGASFWLCVAWGNTKRKRVWWCESLIWRADRKHAEHQTSAVLPQTRASILAKGIPSGRKELVKINEGWSHVTLTLRWCCLNKDLVTPKYCTATWPSGWGDSRFRRSEETGRGHPIPSPWAPCCNPELKSALGKLLPMLKLQC